MQPPGPDVVAQRVPRPDDILFGRLRERVQRGVLPQPLVVLRQDAFDLRLLEHHLGDEDVVRVVGAAPRQVAPVPAIPREQRRPKTTPGGRRRQGGRGSLPVSGR